ncbi:MAG: glycosyltransferase [Bacteroidales bacterium]|nr:glycosyltransferase [Bacteroidales bacterium]
MVSVIVPNYNHALFLEERIQSILNQTYQDFELILLDDCSTDDSRAILEQYRNHPKVSAIQFNEQNSGCPFAQWRKGIDLSKGEWVWIAESDDIADVNFLSILMENVNKYPSVGLAYSHLRWIDANGRLMYSEEDGDEVVFFRGEEFARKKLLYTTTIYNVSSAVFRKEALLSEDWSLFDKMKMCGDYYLYTLLAKKTDVLEICKVLDSYRQHENNTSGKQLSSIGWGIIEGMPILNEIVRDYHIPQSEYALHYARLWAHSRYRFAVNANVAKEFLKSGHWLIVIYFVMVKIKIRMRCIKNNR